MDTSMNAPQGLKPILIEGTDGRFDSYFQFVRWSLEEALEAWWASTKAVDPRSVIKCDMSPKIGSHRTWLTDFNETPKKSSFIISETKNSEWCFVAPMEEFKMAGPFNSVAFGGQFVVRKTEAIYVNYFLNNYDAPMVKFQHYDYRCGGLLRWRTVQRFRGKFDSTFVNEVDFDFPGESPFEGRGWKKFNHEKVYSLCMGMGIDLQDPDFLTGRYVIVDTDVQSV